MDELQRLMESIAFQVRTSCAIIGNEVEIAEMEIRQPDLARIKRACGELRELCDSLMEKVDVSAEPDAKNLENVAQDNDPDRVRIDEL